MTALRDPRRTGLHFWIGLQKSPDLTEHDRRLLGELSPAGIVLFRENFAHGEPYDVWLERLAGLLEAARHAVGRERILVAVDHEGGRVQRTPPPITALPAARRWADRAGEVGRLVGRELASLGVNVDFAPVVDVDSNPQNPIIGDRAFARDAERVAACGGAFLRGLQDEGVLGCLKHFPGHGDTTVDSHLELPTVTADRDTLRARELVPFRRLAAHARLVMTAHVLVPAVDPEAPATLSAPLLRGILREEMGFAGVVVSDDLGMKAVSPLFADPRTAVDALMAGCDQLLLCAHLADTAAALPMAAAVERVLGAGAPEAVSLDRSALRVEALLQESLQRPPRALSDTELAAHAAVVV